MNAVRDAEPVVNDHDLVLNQVLHTLQLLDAPPEEDFDKFTRLVSQCLGVPVALVSLIDEVEDRQYFKSQIGLQGHWAEDRQTPLTHSFCQFVKRDNRPLIVEYAPDDAQVCDNLAIPDLGVRAYLGVPIHGPAGDALGALCAIEDQRRKWLDREVDLMTNLASCVTDQIKLRAALLRSHGLERPTPPNSCAISQNGIIRQADAISLGG